MNESSQSYIFLKIRFFLAFDRLTRSNRFVYFCNCNLAVSILITRYNTHFTHQTTFWSNTIFILYPHDRSTIIARIHSWRIVQFPPINYHVLACSIITFLADQLHANSSCPVINYYFRSSGLIELEPGWPVSIYPGCVSIYFHYRYLLKYRSGGSTRNASDGIASRSRTWAQGFFLSSVILLNKSSRCPGWRRRLPETSSLLSHLPVDSAPEIMLINTDRAGKNARQNSPSKNLYERYKGAWYCPRAVSRSLRLRDIENINWAFTLLEGFRKLRARCTRSSMLARTILAEHAKGKWSRSMCSFVKSL